MIINILYYFLRFVLLCLFNREYQRMFSLHLRIDDDNENGHAFEEENAEEVDDQEQNDKS